MFYLYPRQAWMKVLYNQSMDGWMDVMQGLQTETTTEKKRKIWIKKNYQKDQDGLW